jgi:MFS superfamily sulfate permease-like transporter
MTSGLTVLTVLFLAPLLKDLPNAVLAAIVISSVVGLLNYREMRRFFLASRVDFAMGLAALLGVVFSDPASGLILAVFLSLGVVLYRTTLPRIAVLGRVHGKPHEFVDVARRSDVGLVPDMVVLRLEAGLFYANANEIRRAVEAEVEKRKPTPKGLLLDLGATGFVDLTSIDMMVELVREMNRQSIVVILAHVVGQVRDQLAKADALDEIGATNMVPTLASGVARFAELQSAEHRAMKGTTPKAP